MIDDSGTYTRQLQSRRDEYLRRIVQQFSALEPTLAPLDGRLWSLNQARLATGQDVDRASEYFAHISLTIDRDFMGTRLVKTYFDFASTGRLSQAAVDNLESTITQWEMNDFSRRALWPRRHTENHDAMFLTIGLFVKALRGEPLEAHLDELRQYMMWRFERGFYEWNSHRYQFHTSNALQLLSAHAPAQDVRKGARALLNMMFMERAILGINGFLGGPFMRGYDAQRGCDYLDDNRYDAFLPTLWLAFGVGEPRFDFARRPELSPAGDGFGNGQDPRLNQDEGMFFATSALEPDPIIRHLLREVASSRETVYVGRRATAGYPQEIAPPSDPRTRQCIRYYNTPHVSLGSAQYVDGVYPITSLAPSRYWSVLLAQEPSQVLRSGIEGFEPQRIAQHRNWLVAEGTLRESGGLRSTPVGPWNLYQAGKGLCAHTQIEGWHVVQVSDLDTYADTRAFIDRLAKPEVSDGRLNAVTTEGDSVNVDLETMATRINGALRPDVPDMLHDAPLVRSVYGTGVIEVRAGGTSATYDAAQLLDMPHWWRAMSQDERLSHIETGGPEG